MYIKNDRIIINEDNLTVDIESLKQNLTEFFKTDERFSMYDIEITINIEEAFNNINAWFELSIYAYNHSVQVELGGQCVGQKIDAFAYLVYTTENLSPQLVINNGTPEFYHVFDYAGNSLTNSKTWENDDNETTIEDIISNEFLSRYHI